MKLPPNYLASNTLFSACQFGRASAAAQDFMRDAEERRNKGLSPVPALDAAREMAAVARGHYAVMTHFAAMTREI